MPLTSKDPSTNIKELYDAHRGDSAWPRKRIVAAGLNAARRNGGKVKARPGLTKGKAARVAKRGKKK